MKAGMFSRAHGLPDRIQLGVVQLQAAAVGLARRQPEVLHDFAEAFGAGLDVGFELRRGTLTEARARPLRGS